MSDATNNRPEETPRNRFSSGNREAVEHERSSDAFEGSANTARSGTKPRLLVAGLAAAALLAVGSGAVYAQGQAGSMMSGGAAGAGEGSMGSMMNGSGGMGSMMDGGSMKGSFDENKPFDLQFIDQMTMHHEGAIMSSEHMISDSKRPELRELTDNIQESQSEQIKQMQGFRKEWYADPEQTSSMAAGMMGDGSMMMEGMMGGSMQEMMGGEEADEMFLRMMIPHHQMAVDMAEKALKEAEHPELKELARTIRDEQSAEIELMQGYLEEIEASSETR